MKQRRIALAGSAIAVAILALVATTRDADDVAHAPPPVLSVELTHAQLSTLPLRVAATGNIAAWQEARVGAEADGLRLVAVDADVGDMVRRGQVLARFNADVVAAELAEAVAAVAQAAAQRTEADANAARAQRLDRNGALSAQQIDQ
ncbi:MAG TPA: efflux RND transporter periplasmic adaptor subunit, partial [Tahibacter sp.]|nr:efflux RND transporter periplasmic adaptor subunit [Tahibacter sp.]